MLWLALAARDSGTRASKLLGIKDEVCALDFDLACALRLISFDNECRENQAKLTALEVGKLFGGTDDKTTQPTGNVMRW